MIKIVYYIYIKGARGIVDFMLEALFMGWNFDWMEGMIWYISRFMKMEVSERYVYA